jgi:hypothetical protein
LFYRDKLFSLKPGYDPEYASFSPSNLLYLLLLQDFFSSRHVSEYDLLGADEDWKLQWTSFSREHCWMFVLSRSPSSRLLHLLKFRVLPALRNQKPYRYLLRTTLALRRRLGFVLRESHP